MYRYCEERGINTNPTKQNYDVSLILSLYDETLSLRKNVEKMKNNGIKIEKDKLDSIIKKNRERQQHTIVEWENADNFDNMDNDEPDLTVLDELHNNIIQSHKNVKFYPASSIGGHPSTNTMLDLTIQRIIDEYNSHIVNPENYSEENKTTFGTLNFTSHYMSPFF